jgi:hypothetical protein
MPKAILKARREIRAAEHSASSNGDPEFQLNSPTNKSCAIELIRPTVQSCGQIFRFLEVSDGFALFVSSENFGSGNQVLSISQILWH